MEKTNVIKLKYLRAGQPSGREYTFYTPAPVEVGDIVDIAVVSPDNTSQGMVTAVRQRQKQKLRNRSRKRCWMYKEEQHDKKNSNAQRNRGFCG